MDSFGSYLLRKLYRETTKHGDKLVKIEKQINWNKFKPIIQPMYNNKTPRGGRPNMNPVLMVKLLVLQAWYGFSDPELERQVNDRISFRHFLGPLKLCQIIRQCGSSENDSRRRVGTRLSGLSCRDTLTRRG